MGTCLKKLSASPHRRPLLTKCVCSGQAGGRHIYALLPTLPPARHCTPLVCICVDVSQDQGQDVSKPRLLKPSFTSQILHYAVPPFPWRVLFFAQFRGQLLDYRYRRESRHGMGANGRRFARKAKSGRKATRTSGRHFHPTPCKWQPYALAQAKKAVSQNHIWCFRFTR